MSGDVTLSVSSNPSGNPASTAGNLMTRVSTLVPEFFGFVGYFFNMGCVRWGGDDG